MESYKTIKAPVNLGYYQGLRVIKGLKAKPWDDWYVINRDNRIIGVAGEWMIGGDFISASDCEIHNTMMVEIELKVRS